eukprot:SAG25_NODE_5502_length_652_cov_0.614828_1_plen_22_part_01
MQGQVDPGRADQPPPLQNTPSF